MSLVDLTVVGAGPVGLATAIFARKAGLTVLVLDGYEVPVDPADALDCDSCQ